LVLILNILLKSISHTYIGPNAATIFNALVIKLRHFTSGTPLQTSSRVADDHFGTLGPAPHLTARLAAHFENIRSGGRVYCRRLCKYFHHGQEGIQSKPFTDRKTNIAARTLSIHNLPTDRARELLKPSEDAESLLVSIKKSGHFWV